MCCSVDLFVLLELLLYLFVCFSLSLLLISLVFGLTVAQTTHLPARKKKKGGPGEEEEVVAEEVEEEVVVEGKGRGGGGNVERKINQIN